MIINLQIIYISVYNNSRNQRSIMKTITIQKHDQLTQASDIPYMFLQLYIETQICTDVTYCTVGKSYLDTF